MQRPQVHGHGYTVVNKDCSSVLCAMSLQQRENWKKEEGSCE